jgi:hypothetical protein
VLEKWLRKLRGEPKGTPLDRDGDPRGGMQSEEYRTADPTEIVEDGGTRMSGPGGSAIQPDDR